jgi:hypothetical protein
MIEAGVLFILGNRTLGLIHARTRTFGPVRGQLSRSNDKMFGAIGEGAA